MEDATPIVRDEIRPFARAGGRSSGTSAEARATSPGGAGPDQDLPRPQPPVQHRRPQPERGEELSGDLAKDRARDEGYLYWLAWTAQNTVSLFSTSDAQGPFRRIFLGGVNCNTFTGEGRAAAGLGRAR